MSQAEQLHTLCSWLCIPTQREQRLYLEIHLELLTYSAGPLFAILIAQQADNSIEQQRLYAQRDMFHAIQRQGGTLEAVRNVYINEYGGLVLDPPDWLAHVGELLGTMRSVRQTERMSAITKCMLRDAIINAQHDDSIAPEIKAELHYQLGCMFVRSVSETVEYALKMAIDSYQAALQVYTESRYPAQFAKTLIALGDAYRLYYAGKQWQHLREATRCYEQAIQVGMAGLGTMASQPSNPSQKNQPNNTV